MFYRIIDWFSFFKRKANKNTSTKRSRLIRSIEKIKRLTKNNKVTIKEGTLRCYSHDIQEAITALEPAIIDVKNNSSKGYPIAELYPPKQTSDFFVSKDFLQYNRQAGTDIYFNLAVNYVSLLEKHLVEESDIEFFERRHYQVLNDLIEITELMT